jgi:hypothetical protein
LQYIGHPGNNSHPQTPVKISRKNSNLRLHSKELNSKAENGIHNNSDAHFGCSHNQAHENTVIGNGTILVNEKNHPVRINLTNDFTAPAINIKVHVPSGTSSGDQAQSIPSNSNAFQNPSRRSIRFRRAPSYYGRDRINAIFATIKSNKRFKEYSDTFLLSVSLDLESRNIMHYVFAIAI